MLFTFVGKSVAKLFFSCRFWNRTSVPLAAGSVTKLPDTFSSPSSSSLSSSSSESSYGEKNARLFQVDVHLLILQLISVIFLTLLQYVLQIYNVMLLKHTALHTFTMLSSNTLIFFFFFIFINTAFNNINSIFYTRFNQ